MTPEELKTVRKAAGLSQAEFGERVGVSRLSVANWETGKYRMPVDLMDKLAQAGLTSAAGAAREADNAHKRFVKRLVQVYREMRNDGILTHESIIADLCGRQGLTIPPEAQAQILAEFPDILQPKKED